jgi:hypothetical protein
MSTFDSDAEDDEDDDEDDESDEIVSISDAGTVSCLVMFSGVYKLYFVEDSKPERAKSPPKKQSEAERDKSPPQKQVLKPVAKDAAENAGGFDKSLDDLLRKNHIILVNFIYVYLYFENV